MSATDLETTAADGHRWTLRLHDAGPGTPGLAWVPALGVPARKYEAFAAALAGQGVSCAVHEWRGIGGSSVRARRGVDWGYATLLGQDLPATRARLAATGHRWSLGGHSLGGQFAAMSAAQAPDGVAGLVLAATGVPLASLFRGRQRLGVAAFARTLGPITRLLGYYPGHRLGFAGREAGGVMRDWADTVRHGRYRAYGDGPDMDAALARLSLPVLGLRLQRDWLVPAASLDCLLGKLGPGPREVQVLDDAALGCRADHFRWMREPAALAARIAAWMRAIP